jgi:DNA-binding NarL/FixJ family response regulator
MQRTHANIQALPGILIVDDHKLYRSGLHFLLIESGLYQVVAEASNGSEFIGLLEHLKPDLVIMDIHMPVMDGIEANRRALRYHPGLKILILSMHSEWLFLSELLDAGVMGFVNKNAENEELLEAIRRVLQGGTYFSQELLLNIIRENSYNEIVPITPREKEVLELISQGFSSKEIATRLKVSHRTIERHRTKLFEKTGLKNSVSLVVYAIKNKLIIP